MKAVTDWTVNGKFFETCWWDQVFLFVAKLAEVPEKSYHSYLLVITMRHLLMPITKISTIGLAGIKFWSCKIRNRTFWISRSSSLKNAFRKWMRGQKERKRWPIHILTFQLSFWPFNWHFEHSTCVLTFKCDWTENFYLNFSTFN